MKVKETIFKWWNAFEDLFMTSHSCVCCEREILDKSKFSLCEKCLKNLDVIGDVCCEKCGDKISSGNKLCNVCKDYKFSFDSNVSFAYYNDVSAKFVKSLKYGGKKYLAKKIAECLMTKRDFFEDVDMIAFVPISKERKKERKFNQAEEIAKYLSKFSGKSLVNLIEKKETGLHQTGLSQMERRKNLKGSFKIVEGLNNQIKGKVVLIIDDVFTTGATLDECSKIIKSLKPKKIKTMTFAKTKFET